MRLGNVPRLDSRARRCRRAATAAARRCSLLVGAGLVGAARAAATRRRRRSVASPRRPAERCSSATMSRRRARIVVDDVDRPAVARARPVFKPFQAFASSRRVHERRERVRRRLHVPAAVRDRHLHPRDGAGDSGAEPAPTVPITLPNATARGRTNDGGAVRHLPWPGRSSLSTRGSRPTTSRSASRPRRRFVAVDVDYRVSPGLSAGLW